MLAVSSRMRPNSGFAEDELMDETVFENFSLEMMTVTNGTLRVRHGGSGPPLAAPRTSTHTHDLVAGRKQAFFEVHYCLPGSVRFWPIVLAKGHARSCRILEAHQSERLHGTHGLSRPPPLCRSWP